MDCSLLRKAVRMGEWVGQVVSKLRIGNSHPLQILVKVTPETIHTMYFAAWILHSHNCTEEKGWSCRNKNSSLLEALFIVNYFIDSWVFGAHFIFNIHLPCQFVSFVIIGRDCKDVLPIFSMLSSNQNTTACKATGHVDAQQIRLSYFHLFGGWL